MSKKYGTLSGEFLKILGKATGFFTWPIEGTEGWRYEQLYGSRRNFLNTVSHLKKRGMVKSVSRQGKNFLELTSKGQLELLLQKAVVKTVAKWDGKWRMVIFDIPEDARDKRDTLRRLLKTNQFVMLQASVFVSPFPLNREAVDYLKQTGLIAFIRFGKIEELDDDRDLRKKFKL